MLRLRYLAPPLTRSFQVSVALRGWSNGKHDPTIAHTDRFIRLKRTQQRKSLQETLSYVEGIVKAGFQARPSTLIALIHKDVVTFDQIRQYAELLKLKETFSILPVYSIVMQNFMQQKRTDLLDYGQLVQQVLDFYNAATSAQDANPTILLNAVNAFFHLEVPEITQNFPDPRIPGAQNSPMSWHWRRVLLTAHTYPGFPRRKDIMRLLLPLVTAEHRAISPDAWVNQCIAEMWQHDSHDAASRIVLNALVKLKRTDTQILTAWKVLCFTKFSNSYTLPTEILEEFLRSAPPRLHAHAVCSLLAAHEFAMKLLEIRRYRRYVHSEEIDRQATESLATQSVCISLLAGKGCTRLDRLTLQSQMLRLRCASLHTGQLYDLWEAYMKDAGVVDEPLLAEMLLSCSKQQPLADIESAGLLLHSAILRDGPPSQSSFIEWIHCLANGNALGAALAALERYVDLSIEQHLMLIAILDCGWRVGKVTSTRYHLQRFALEVYQHPKVLLHNSRIRPKGTEVAEEDTSEAYPIIESINNLLAQTSKVRACVQ
ncbi:hypothetical protein BKA62DRAFT_17037 [Auriculariales sp. MPI-PUGE-AT-0066]|nr:hypothetical protein BKA62DRAFT_17037 [Auriculariales sp. MPI-PUGE-AT-0066]